MKIIKKFRDFLNENIINTEFVNDKIVKNIEYLDNSNEYRVLYFEDGSKLSVITSENFKNYFTDYFANWI